MLPRKRLQGIGNVYRTAESAAAHVRGKRIQINQTAARNINDGAPIGQLRQVLATEESPRFLRQCRCQYQYPGTLKNRLQARKFDRVIPRTNRVRIINPPAQTEAA